MDWEKREEVHLQYVMCTRPKHTLNFISEKEVAPFMAFIENNSLYKELKNLKEEIVR
jgi:hypothetical protein